MQSTHTYGESQVGVCHGDDREPLARSPPIRILPRSERYSVPRLIHLDDLQREEQVPREVNSASGR